MHSYRGRFAYVNGLLVAFAIAAACAGMWLIATDPVEVERVVPQPALASTATPEEIQARLGPADGQVTAAELRQVPDGLVCNARAFGPSVVALVCWAVQP